MQKIVSSNTKSRYISITLDTESDVYEFFRDGVGECHHDVPKQVLMNWAKDQGFDESQNLFDFVEQKFKEGLADSLHNHVEKHTTPKFTWISFDDMD